MSDPLGSLCLVLHAHVPYVLNHARYPHGEHWLYEAAAESYLPLLEVLAELALRDVHPGLTIGLTPVLLEQLAHPRFKDGFAGYLAEGMEQARRDHAEFQSTGQQHLARLADWWRQWYAHGADRFARIDRDIPRAFAEHARGGRLEVLTGAATHGYLPLLLEDSSLRAQVRAGVATSQRLLGWKPQGMWLPECAYRPAGKWESPVLEGYLADRVGVDRIVADEGVSHFFVEDVLLDRAGRNPLRPMGVLGPDGRPTGCAFARHGLLCEQVWSGKIGYPGAAEYLEFHKRHIRDGGPPGLRYWKITGRDVDLGGKEPYAFEDVGVVLQRHVQHFCDTVRRLLAAGSGADQSRNVLTASFDAELFGHWWFEGPRFLCDVLLELGGDPRVELLSAAEYLEKFPPRGSLHLEEGSWGEGSDHRVWLNDRTRWIWEIEHGAERRFGQLCCKLPWQTNAALRELLERAGRELLLMQASDWPFLIHTRQAADYAAKRFCSHATRFDHLCDIAHRTAAGETIGALDEHHIADADLHDVIFAHIDLNWWSS